MDGCYIITKQANFTRIKVVHVTAASSLFPKIHPETEGGDVIMFLTAVREEFTGSSLELAMSQ